MASPAISVRLEAETYKALVKLAELERKTLTELTRELIEVGLGKKEAPDTPIVDELKEMRAELKELTTKSVKAGAAALYYARLSTDFTQEAAHYVVHQQPLDPETRKERVVNWDKNAREFEQHFLNTKLEKL